MIPLWFRQAFARPISPLRLILFNIGASAGIISALSLAVALVMGIVGIFGSAYHLKAMILMAVIAVISHLIFERCKAAIARAHARGA